MRDEIEKQLLVECDKHIRRHMVTLRAAAAIRDKYHKRTGKPAGQPQSRTPRHWSLDQLFNPYYVRSHAATIAHALSIRLREGSYKPRPSLRVQVPKPRGGTRGISIFTIVDSAVSTWLFKRLLERNCAGFSNYSYAYRFDRNAQHAVDNLSRALIGRQRAYLLEYDFTKYFDNISHKYLIDVIHRYGKISPREDKLIGSFLDYEYAEDFEAYRTGAFKKSDKGFPQGAAISLFFANVACLELDNELERTGAVFARYADDTVILCEDYANAHRCAGLMLAHSARSGAPINFLKSDGISLLADGNGPLELKAKKGFVFLGHYITWSGISPSPATVARIKKNLSSIIHKNLLLYIKRGEVNRDRFAKGIDWDLITCLNELRRYIYGSSSEFHVEQALNKKRPLSLSTCALSHFPLVGKPTLFIQLDGWLADNTFRAYCLRRKILKEMGVDLLPLAKSELIGGSWYTDSIRNEAKLPSFVRSWRYVRKCYLAYGLKHFPTPPEQSS